MEQMNGAVPAALSYSLSQMNSVAFNSYKISPSTGATNVSPNGQIRFLLPTNGLLDAKNTKLTFSLTSTASKGCRFPVHADTLISKIEIRAGGSTIYSGSNFHNILENIKYNVGVKKSDGVTGHDFFCDGGDAVGKGILATNTSESYDSAFGSDSNLFAVDLGDFANISPRLLSLNLIPQLEIVISLAEAAVLACVKTTVLRGGTDSITTVHGSADGATWTMDNPQLYCNMYSMAAGAYENAVRSKIDDVGYVSFCWEHNLCFNQAWTGTTRFSLASLSLKRLTAVWRRQSATSIKGAIPIAGGAAADFDGDGAVYGALYGSAGANNSGTTPYQGAIQQFSIPVSAPAHNANIENGNAFDYDTAGGCEFQWKIQSSPVPVYFADAASQAELTKAAWNVEKMEAPKAMAQFLYNYHSFAIPLSLPESPLDRKVISGLNLMGTNAFIELTSQGSNRDTSNYDVFVFATCDHVLRVGAGKAVELLT